MRTSANLLDFLEESSLEQDTILIFMGDNGTAAGASMPNEKVKGFNAGMRAHKGSVYDGGHRVACFVRWPARFAKTHKVEQLTSHRDWLPTLIELCDLNSTMNIKFDGQSIAPLLQAEATDWPSRTLFVERQADQPKLEKTPSGKSTYPQYAVMTEQWRLVNGELFDIKKDPGQYWNIAGENPEVVSDLYTQYEQYYADVFSHDAAYTQFQLGAPEENPTQFTVRDWHPTSGHVIWMPQQLSDNTLAINGFWAVNVTRAGRYEVRLTRYPDDALAPMQANQAGLLINDKELIKDLDPKDSSVTFQLQLQQGPAILQTWITDANDGSERGAYFVTVTRR